MPHEPDFFFFRDISKVNQNLVFIDVGANAGQSAISFLMNCPTGRVVSFEPNLLYQSVLKGVQNFLGRERFDFHMFGLSDSEDVLDLYVPQVDGIAYMQEASLCIDQFEKPWVSDRLRSYGGKIELVSLRSTFKPADTVIDHADIVKIDAEGAELSVLRGMSALIDKCSPIFLIENNDYSNVTDCLGEFDYSAYRFSGQRLIPMTGESTNCFYLTPDHFVSYDISIAL